MIEPSLKEVQSINQAKKKNPDNIKVVMDIIENCFVTGKAYNGKEAIKITKDDIQDLPISVITKVTDFLLQISRKPTN